jgi:hypothetical protein
MVKTMRATICVPQEELNIVENESKEIIGRP